MVNDRCHFVFKMVVMEICLTQWNAPCSANIPFFECHGSPGWQASLTSKTTPINRKLYKSIRHDLHPAPFSHPSSLSRYKLPILPTNLVWLKKESSIQCPMTLKKRSNSLDIRLLREWHASSITAAAVERQIAFIHTQYCFQKAIHGIFIHSIICLVHMELNAFEIYSGPFF